MEVSMTLPTASLTCKHANKCSPRQGSFSRKGSSSDKNLFLNYSRNVFRQQPLRLRSKRDLEKSGLGLNLSFTLRSVLMDPCANYFIVTSCLQKQKTGQNHSLIDAKFGQSRSRSSSYAASTSTSTSRTVSSIRDCQ